LQQRTFILVIPVTIIVRMFTLLRGNYRTKAKVYIPHSLTYGNDTAWKQSSTADLYQSLYSRFANVR